MKYPLMELGIGGILAQSFRFCRDHAKFLIILAAFPLAVDLITSPFCDSVFPTPPDSLGHFSWASADSNIDYHAPRWVGIVVILISSLFYPVWQGAAAWGITQRYLGFEVSVRDCLCAAWRRKGRLLLASVVSGLGVMLGLCLCIAPGIYLCFLWFLLYPVLMFEDVSAMDSMKRSQRLMPGHFLKAFGAGLPVAVTAVIVELTFNLLPGTSERRFRAPRTLAELHSTLS